MKKTLCLILVLVLAVMLCGCASKTNAKANEESSTFTAIEKNFNYVVFRHNDTGVYYIRVGYGSPVVMVNADGTPYTGK